MAELVVMVSDNHWAERIDAIEIWLPGPNVLRTAASAFGRGCGAMR